MNESELKTVVRKGFDEASAGYDKPALRFFKNSAEHLAASLALRGDERILDVATGTGHAALAVSARLKDGEVSAFDLSPGMIAQAQKKARAAGLENLVFECRDVDEANYPAHRFDIICCNFGVFFWPDMEKNLRRLLAWLKPGGAFAMTSFADGSFMPQSELALRRFRQFGVQLPETYTWQRLDSAEKHRALLQQADLQDIRSETVSMGYYLDTPEDWWDLILYTGFRSFLNRLSPEQVLRYRKEHLEEIAATVDELGVLLKVDVIFSRAKAKN